MLQNSWRNSGWSKMSVGIMQEKDAWKAIKICLVKVPKVKLILTNSFSKLSSCASLVVHLLLQFRLLVWFSSFYLVLESKKSRCWPHWSKMLHHMLKNSYRYSELLTATTSADKERRLLLKCKLSAPII